MGKQDDLLDVHQMPPKGRKPVGKPSYKKPYGDRTRLDHGEARFSCRPRPAKNDGAAGERRRQKSTRDRRLWGKNFAAWPFVRPVER